MRIIIGKKDIEQLKENIIGRINKEIKKTIFSELYKIKENFENNILLRKYLSILIKEIVREEIKFNTK